MLFLRRKIGDSVVIDDTIEITVLEISGKTVKLGFEYPKEIKILRREIYDRIQAENQAAAATAASFGETYQKMRDKTEKDISKIG